MNDFRKRNFLDRLNDAIDGMVSVFKEQRNMKLHLLMAIIIFGLGVFVGMKKMELIGVIFALGMIIFAEMINSCLEMILDFIHPKYNPDISKIKKALAGSVLFIGLGGFLILYLLFTSYIPYSIENGFRKLRGASWHLSFFSLLLIIVVVILTKAFFKRGKPLRGGLPSGHSALAFSIWMSVSMITSNLLVSILVLFLAIMISASRLRGGIHNLWEVILGAVVGITITLTIFQIFSL
ncbi:MAG TPA: phosphatase PAP2 family protein [Candidatus Omnitrophica bacterium]|nr:phosphatase PAP2 family protein [Candidatus Omnitrophota bacterium]